VIAVRGDNGIYLVDPNSSAKRLVRGTGSTIDGSWSPDGRVLAVESQHESGATDLYILRPGEGDHPVVLKNAWDSSWSPKGLRLSVVRYCGAPSCPSRRAIYTASVDGTGIRRLSTPSDDPEGDPGIWSPDGKWIAYGTKNRVAIRSPDGDEVSFPARYANEGFHELAWSPDSSRLAFATDDGLFVVQRGGDALRKLASDNALDLAWSPDGSTIAFTRARGRLHAGAALIELETAKERDLAPNLAESGVPVWSPDGKEVAFLGTKSGEMTKQEFLGGESQLWVVRADGTDLHSLGGGWSIPPYGSITWLHRAPGVGNREVSGGGG
jgi:Tol biopolymer transport system component